MNLHKLPIITALLITSAGSLHAQTLGTSKDLGNEDITIVKEYQPVLNDAFKINIVPAGDTTTQESVTLQYNIDPSPANSNYTLIPIKPVRIKDDNIKKLYHGFVKGGYGLENMPLLDVYYNSLRSKKSNGGFNFHHLSASGKINDYGSPAFSENYLGLHGSSFFDKFKLNGLLNYDRDVVHYYGYKTPPDLYSKAETKHLMNNVSGDFGVESLGTKKDQLKYYGAINFWSFSDNRDSKETNFGIRLGAVQQLGPGKIKADVITNFSGIDQPRQNYNRNLIRMQPHYIYNIDLLTLEGGLNFAFDAEGTSSDVRIYPHLHADMQVIRDAISVFAEVSGDVDRNTLRQFSKENPFLTNYIPMLNSNRKLSLSAGTNIKLERNLMLSASGRYSRILNKSFFVNLPDTLFPVTFSTGYDDVNEFILKAALEYKTAEKFTAAASVQFTSYDTKYYTHPLYTPALRLGINGQYAMAEKIYIKADLFYNSDQYAIAYKPGLEINYTKLNGYFDANLGVDYRYSKMLSVFVQLNNLGFSQYFKYYRYPSYRFIGMAGATLSF